MTDCTLCLESEAGFVEVAHMILARVVNVHQLRKLDQQVFPLNKRYVCRHQLPVEGWLDVLQRFCIAVEVPRDTDPHVATRQTKQQPPPQSRSVRVFLSLVELWW